MSKTRSEGFFAVTLPRDPGNYTFDLTRWNGSHVEIEDPYRFPPLISEFDLHLHGEGTLYESIAVWARTSSMSTACAGVRFAVWAPNAEIVSVVGDFNEWDTRRHPMRRRTGGVWEIFIPGARRGHQLQVFRAVALRGLPASKRPTRTAFAMRGAAEIGVGRLGSRHVQWGDAAWMDSARAERTG